MKELKTIVGFTLAGLSILLYYQFWVSVRLLYRGIAQLDEVWLDLLLFFGSGVLITVYSIRLLLSVYRKKRANSPLDEELVNQNRQE